MSPHGDGHPGDGHGHSHGHGHGGHPHVSPGHSEAEAHREERVPSKKSVNRGGGDYDGFLASTWARDHSDEGHLMKDLHGADDGSRYSMRNTKHRGSVRVPAEESKKKEEASGPKSTFVDAAAMKEKVRQNLSKPQHVVSDYYKDYGICQLIARSQMFDKCTLTIIALNAIWIAVDTDLNDAAMLIEAHPVFVLAENFFCAFFTFEWYVRYMSFRRKRDGLKDVWFCFDSFMVCLMVNETWVFTSVTALMDGGGGGGNTGVLRVARLMRLSRMCRMARLLRAMPELMIMIKGMLAATRSVFFTLCLLVMIMYVFGIAFRQLAEGEPVAQKYFKSVGMSMRSLLIFGVFLDNVGTLAVDLSECAVYLSVMFFLFILIGSLTVMNMLVGVLCEVVSAVAATEQEEMLVTYVHDRLSQVMSMLDADGGGTISKKEFLQILDNVDAVRCLADVGVDVYSLVDLADYIFEDDDASNGDELELDFCKFMEVVLQLRGTNQATVKDIVDLRKFMRLGIQENYKQSCDILAKLEEQANLTNDLLRKCGDGRKSSLEMGRASSQRRTEVESQPLKVESAPPQQPREMSSQGKEVGGFPTPSEPEAPSEHRFSTTSNAWSRQSSVPEKYEVEKHGTAKLPQTTLSLPVTADAQLLSLVQVDESFEANFEMCHESLHTNGNWQPIETVKIFKGGNGHAPVTSLESLPNGAAPRKESAASEVNGIASHQAPSKGVGVFDSVGGGGAAIPPDKVATVAGGIIPGGNGQAPMTANGDKGTLKNELDARFQRLRKSLAQHGLDDRETLEVQSHVDLMCRHLAVGLGELLQLSIKKASLKTDGQALPASNGSTGGSVNACAL
eukprot:TRINITY_DN2651_c0_g2_i1.p1 TRINITY_DN2651_c0_g2~~TRINITY_DN2651_c0_g2_i1.p1  ORF type:complete len:846 (+),score=209.53 TRINITY_DN2651_c0_g2_i1:81-2618(+)